MNNLIQKPVSLTKTSLKEAAQAFVKEVLETGDVQRTWSEVKWAEEYIAEIVEGLKTAIIENPPTDTFRTGGVKVEVQYRSDYSYEHDSTWFALKKSETEIAERRKERETMLKSLTVPVAAPDTGELIEPARLLGKKAVVKTTLPK